MILLGYSIKKEEPFDILGGGYLFQQEIGDKVKADSCRGTEEGFLSRNNSQAPRKGIEQFTGICWRGEVGLKDPEGGWFKTRSRTANHKTA